jgi:hypothetical protein
MSNYHATYLLYKLKRSNSYMLAGVPVRLWFVCYLYGYTTLFYSDALSTVPALSVMVQSNMPTTLCWM